MKSRVPLLVLSFASLLTSAFAAEVKMPTIKFDWRFDAVKQFNETRGDENRNTALTPVQKNNNEGKSLRFTIPLARFDVSGKAYDDIGYRVRWRLNRSSEPSNANVDKTGQNLDYAYIDKKFTPEMKLRVGKQAFYRGGWEAAPSSKDMYSYSAGNNAASSYATGLGLFYKLTETQEVIVQVLNNSHGEYNQEAFLMGGQYTGSFMDKLFQPVFSFHLDPRSKQLRGGTTPSERSTVVTTEEWKEGYDNYLAIGNKSEFSNGFAIEADYLRNDFKGYNSLTKEAITTSYVSTIRYQWENFKPQVKFSYSVIGQKELKRGNNSDELYSYHAALEYYPDLKNDFRFHGAFVSEHYKRPGTTVGATDDNVILIGSAGSF